MSGPRLAVGPAVIEEMVRLAAMGVPGVCRIGRGGPVWRRWLGGRAVRVRIVDGAVQVRLAIVARPTQPLGAAHPGGARRGRGGPRAPPRPGTRERQRRRRRRRCLTGAPAVTERKRGSGPIRPGSLAPGRPAPRPRGGLRGRVRPADAARRSWSATWPRSRATRASAALARAIVDAVVAERERIDVAIGAAAPPVPGRLARPDGPRTAPLRALARCYTPARRRPGWRSPSGSSWHGSTVETRCAA